MSQVLSLPSFFPLIPYASVSIIDPSAFRVRLSVDGVVVAVVALPFWDVSS